MNLDQLLNLLERIQTPCGKQRVYIQMEGLNGREFDPSLLNDLSEIVMDVEDDVIVLRAVVD